MSQRICQHVFLARIFVDDFEHDFVFHLFCHMLHNLRNRFRTLSLHWETRVLNKQERVVAFWCRRQTLFGLSLSETESYFIAWHWSSRFVWPCIAMQMERLAQLAVGSERAHLQQDGGVKVHEDRTPHQTQLTRMCFTLRAV